MRPSLVPRGGPRAVSPQPHPEALPAASRRELVVLALYFFTLVAVTDALNVRLGVELMTAAVAIAAVAITRQAAAFWRDWWYFLLGLILWNLSGPIAAGSPFPHHLNFMLNLDRLLFGGRDLVVVVQHALAHHGQIGPLDVVTAASYNLHLPEPYIAGYFLWRMNRLVYLQFAASALLLLVLGLITFIVFPAIPPWMASARFGRLPGVYNGFGPVLHWYPLPFHGTPIFYVFHLGGDAVAAFPSEHAAFPMLEFLALWRVLGRRALLLLLWVAWVVFVVLYLGEHWFTDVLAGWAYALVIFYGVRRLTESR